MECLYSHLQWKHLETWKKSSPHNKGTDMLQHKYDDGIKRAVWGADCWTYHKHCRSVLLLYIVPRLHKKSKLIQPSFNIEKLMNIKYHDQFAASLDDKLTSHGPLTEKTTQKLGLFNMLVRQSAQSTLGLKKRVHQDWFGANEESITNFIEDKWKAYLPW